MIMIFLFILTFLYWITAALDVRIHGQLELERKYWNRYDPTLIAEGIYCLATIMAFLKLLYICQLDYHLGPLQLSLAQMIKDVIKFIILFSIIIFAFTAGNTNTFKLPKVQKFPFFDKSTFYIHFPLSFSSFFPELLMKFSNSIFSKIKAQFCPLFSIYFSNTKKRIQSVERQE